MTPDHIHDIDHAKKYLNELEDRVQRLEQAMKQAAAEISALKRQARTGS